MIEESSSMKNTYSPIIKYGECVTYNDNNLMYWCETSLLKIDNRWNQNKKSKKEQMFNLQVNIQINFFCYTFAILFC